MNGFAETKSEIRARLEELQKLEKSYAVSDETIPTLIAARRYELSEELNKAEEDPSTSIIRSHKIICEVKQMDEKSAYGNDPALYFSAGISAEAGELLNKVIRGIRNGLDKRAIIEAVKSELPDVIIYAHVLAHIMELDLTNLVNEKVEVVIQRARDGYYGGPLKSTEK